MSRALAVLVLVALLLGIAGAAEPVTSRHLFSDSSEPGDWSTYEGRFAVPAGDPAEAGLASRFLVTYRVKSGDKNRGFEVQTLTDPPHAREWETFHMAPDSGNLRDLFHLKDAKIDDVVITEEDKVVAGETFRCRRVSFTTTEQGSVVQQNDVWVASRDREREFHGLRVVALSAVPIHGVKRPVTLTLELRGHGRAGRTEWGRTAAELAGVR